MAMETEKIFSYGTLRQENVQLATFGRLLSGQEDKVKGFRLDEVEITDFDVISKSGKNIHKIMVHTGIDSDLVEGVIFEISKDELKIADNYEVEEYKRKKLSTINGNEVWVYIAP